MCAGIAGVGPPCKQTPLLSHGARASICVLGGSLKIVWTLSFADGVMGPGRKYVHSRGHPVGYGRAGWLLTQSEEEAGVAGTGEITPGVGRRLGLSCLAGGGGRGELPSRCQGFLHALPGGA